MINIELHEFYAALSRCQSGPAAAIAAQLRAKYSCFREDVGGDRRRAITNHADDGWRKKPIVALERPKIGTRELSREAIAKKEFVAALNKLSPANKANVIRSIHIREDFGEMYIRLLWDAFLRSPDYQQTYLEVIDHIASTIGADATKSAFEELWETYLADQAWIPVIEENENYDEFCDYVKAKKRSLASLNAWILLTKYGIINATSELLERIYMDCDNRIETRDKSKILEVLLELMIESVRAGASSKNTRRGMHWKEVASEFPPAIRFKIYDLYDIQKNDKEK